MSYLDGPFTHEATLGCSCKSHRTQNEHDALAVAQQEALRTDPGLLSTRVFEAAAMKALFPRDENRRRFLRAVGATTAAAAIAEFLPLGVLTAMAKDKGALERKELKIGFIPITCSTPLLMADPLNF